MVDGYKYLAFISYKREDEKWAQWLQQRLEHYKLPSSVRKLNKSLPERVSPIFKDTTDLAGGVLEKAIQDALSSAKYLIVICSPNAAQSLWVCKEVQAFIDSGREEFIIPFIVDGEPNSLNIATECFPKNLRELSGERELLGININEMGRDAAAIKVVSRMFELQFDALWQRWERERKMRRRLITASLSLGVVIAISIICVMYFQHRKMQINQARAVAYRATQLVDEGNAYLARKLLIEVLPREDDFIKRPYVSNVEHALRYATDYTSTIFGEHGSPVKTLQITPDGQFVVSVCSDNTVRLWDVRTGSCIKTLELDVPQNTQCCISHDCKYIAMHSYFTIDKQNENDVADNILQLYSIETASVVKTFEGHNSWIDEVRFTPDGKRLISTSRDKTIRIWSVEEGECIRTINETWDIVPIKLYTYGDGEFLEYTGPKDRLIAISGNGEYLAAPCHNESNDIKVWSLVDDGVEMTVSALPAQCEINGIALSSDGRYILISYDNYDTCIALLDAQNGVCIKKFTLSDSGYDKVFSISFSPDDRQFITACYQKMVKLWDVESNECIKEFDGHKGVVYDACFSSDGRYILSASEDGTVRLRDVKPKAFERRIDADNLTFDACYSPDGKYVASVSIISDDIVKDAVMSGNWSKLNQIKADLVLWDCKTGEQLGVYSHDSFLLSVQFSRDGSRLVTVSSGFITIWDVWSGECIKEYNLEEYKPQYATFSPDEEAIIYVDQSNLIKIMDIESGDCIKELEGHCDYVGSIIFSPDEKYLISLSNDLTIRFWDIDSGECVRVFDEGVSLGGEVCFMADGKRFLSSSENNCVRLWDIESGEYICEYEGHLARVNDVALSPDEKYMITSSDDKTLRLWSVESGKCIGVLNGHNDRIFSVNFSPDGKYVVSASADDTFRLWEVESRNCVYEYNFKDWVHCATFSPNGQYIILTTHNTGMYYWRYYDLEELIEMNIQQFGDCPLTTEERKEYFLE